MKISISDIKKAIQWIEVNTNESHVSLIMVDSALIIDCKDKYEQSIEIKLFNDNMMLPKIRKETLLK